MPMVKERSRVFIKDIIVNVPFGTVNWEASDHSANIAQIGAAANAAGFTLPCEPLFNGSSVNPESPYTSSILHYLVEVTG